VIAAWTGFLLQAAKSISRFASFPTSTTITVEHPERLEFPAVTVCNHNYFVDSSITNVSVRAALSKVNFLDNPGFTADDIAILEDHGGWKGFTEKIGIQAEQFILECIWKLCYGLPCCSYRNFTKVITPMGNCFTFHGTDMFVSRRGPAGGLTIVLNLQLDKYLGVGFGTAGVQVLVHQPREYPDSIYETGFAAFPGTKTSVRIQETRMTKVIRQYDTACHDPELIYHDVYTLSACFEECKQVLIEEYCHCRELYTSKWYKGNLRVCSFRDYDCAQNVIAFSSVQNKSYCECPLPCSQRLFDVQISQAQVPAPHLQEDIAASYGVSVDYIRQNNLIWLEVFYPQISYTNIVQETTYTIYNMFGDIGGQLGLFLGASILTLLEFGQYLIFACHIARRQRCDKVNF
jgi:hypothetical protein